MIQHTKDEVVRLANASLIDLYWKVGKYESLAHEAVLRDI